MTREELKKKYHNQVVQALYYVGAFNAEKEVAGKVNVLLNACEELGLEVNEFRIANYGDSVKQSRQFQIMDKLQPITGDNPKTPISVEEFLEDFGHYVNEEQQKEVIKILDVLASMKIKDVHIKHIGVSRNMKKLAEDGFIQGYTSNEASLWWNPNGRRLLFVRNEGVFELTDKVEPKEEAHV